MKIKVSPRDHGIAVQVLWSWRSKTPLLATISENGDSWCSVERRGNRLQGPVDVVD